MALNTVTLTGTLARAGGALAVFTPSSWLTDAADDLLIPPSPEPVSLDSAGRFRVSLLATDNTAPLPTGWFWTVVISGIPGVAAEVFSFFLAFADGSEQDISGLAQITPGMVMTAYMPLAGGQFTGAVIPAVVTLSQSGGTVAVSAAAGNDFRLTLTASGWTIANPSSPAEGQVIVFGLAQDGTGSRTVTWGSAYDFGTAGAPTLSTGAAKVDVVGFRYHAAVAKWLCQGSALGF